MQLDACLRSFVLQCGDYSNCHKQVIYKSSDSEHTSQYATLQTEHPDVEFTAEGDFHQDLHKALAGFEYVLFVVDDNTFVRPFSLASIVSALTSEKAALGFSLRLGRNITRCYPHNDAPQTIPEASQLGGGILLFRWTDATLDFGYPLEVSSSVFRVSQLLPLLQAPAHITHPNHLEECIDRGKSHFVATHPLLLCFEHSVAFCNPVNLVQHTHPNRVAHEPSYSILSLMERFDLGYRIDVGAFQGLTPDGCHQELPLTFLPPRTAWDSLVASLHISTNPRTNGGREHRNHEDFSLQSTVTADEIGQEDLYAALLALRACKAAATESSAPWLSSLGRHYLKQRAIIEKDLSVIGKTASDHLARIIWLEAQLKTANEELLLARESQTLARESQTASLREAENERLRAKILDKWAFRALTRINSLIRFTKAFFTFPILFHNCQFEITTAFIFPAGHLFLQGWLLSKANRGNTVIRAKVTRYDDRQHVNVNLCDRPDIVELDFEDGSRVAVGFEVTLPLGRGLNIVQLQYQMNRKWRTFARHSISNGRFGKSRRPLVVSQERWPDDQPLVSVVISCHNSKKNCLEALDSVLAQTCRDLEVIVVDCGSEIPDNIFATTETDKPMKKLIRQNNVQPSTARSAGIKEAAGKYVCCLNADDRIGSTYLEKCIFRMETEMLDICDSSKISLGHFSPCEPTIAGCLTRAAVFRRNLSNQCEVFGQTSLRHHQDSDFWLYMGEAGALATAISEPQLFLPAASGPSSKRKTQARGSVSQNVADCGARLIRRLLPPRKRKTFPTGGRDSTVVTNPLVNILRGFNRVNSNSNHVLVCLPFLTIGGAERLISQICQGLSKQGFRISVLTTQTASPAHGTAESWFETAASNIYCLPRFLGKDGWKRFILCLINNQHVDILWQAGSELIYELLPEIRTAFPRLKVADFLFNEFGHTGNNRRFDYCIDVTVTENWAVRSWLLGHGESESRIRVIPNGINLRLFSPDPKKHLPFEAPCRDFVVGFFGRLSHEKAPDVFVEVAARFKGEKRILFLLVGDGPMMDEVSQLAKTHGLDDSIRLLGFADSREYLPCCDIVIAPSRLDGRPNSVMEALAMGIPVVASDVGGMAELVSDGKTGFLCTPSSVDQLEEKVAFLFKERRLCKELGANARFYAEKHFDIQTTIASFGQAFNGLIHPTEALH